MSSRAGAGRRDRDERLARLRADRDLLARDHPYLTYDLDEPHLTGIARGAVPMLLPDGQVDPIEIAIDFHHGYLPGPPTASDAGRRWLPDDYRHIPQDHSFCLYLQDIDEPDLSQPEALQLFMLDVVCFLEQQLIYDRVGRFAGPTWPHRRDAFALYIVERLDRECTEAVAPLWEAMRGHQLSRNAPCPCDGGTKYMFVPTSAQAHLCRPALYADLTSETHGAREVVRLRSA